MTRKQRFSGQTYAASALGAVLVGLVAVLLLPDYPLSGGAVLAAAVIALAGLGLRWRKRVQRRRRGASHHMRI